MGSLHQAINDYLADSGNLRQATSVLCIEVWPQIVGDWYARNTHILGVENAEVRVLCDSPSTAQQLSLDQKEIITRLNTRLGGHFVNCIRASSAGPVAGQLAARLRRPEPMVITDEELDQVELTAGEKRFCEGSTCDIDDDEIRQSFLRMVTRELKRGHVKHQRGYRICTLCGAQHNEIGPYCAACGMELSQASK